MEGAATAVTKGTVVKGYSAEGIAQQKKQEDNQ